MVPLRSRPFHKTYQTLICLKDLLFYKDISSIETKLFINMHRLRFGRFSHNPMMNVMTF